MSLIHAVGIKRHYGAQEVLRGVDLRIEAGDKIGVVGRNGAGKTTLLRLIEGEETPDGGELNVARGARLGYVTQRPRFEPGQSAREYVETGLDEVHSAAADLERVAEAMGSAAGDELERLIVRHGELSARMEFLGGWESERRVEKVLSGIGLPREHWDREALTLSGGEKSRTALARELVATPDLLLLDEPTNHLDLVGIEWIETYIRELKGAVLIVSHDRRLLERSVDAILEVERGELRRYPGNYSSYLRLREERFQSELRAFEGQDDKLRKEANFIKKHMGSQRTSEAKGRLKRLKRVERLDKPQNDVRRPVIRAARVERGGELVLEATDLACGYGDRLLFGDVTLRLGRGERLGIVGPNGTGKSTLLKVLAGRLAPVAGKITAGHKAVCGYFDQETEDLDRAATPYKTIQRSYPQMTDLEVRSHLARFLFRGSDVDAEVGTLSGGERARLYLSRLVLSEPSWLALDEPTNHLDLAARTALEEFLGAFPGALVCVSHDREFLDALCTSILEVSDGRVTRYAGNYSEYRQRVAQDGAARVAERESRAARESAERKAAEKRAAEKKAASEKSARRKGGADAAHVGARRAAEAPKVTAKVRRNPYLLKKLEEAIIALEAERERLLQALGNEEVYRNPDALRERQFELAEIERDLEKKNSEWESFG